MEAAREQDRAPVSKTHQLPVWGSKFSPEREKQAGVRLPTWRGWMETEAKKGKRLIWEK